jgi:hypothetical protein
MLENGADIRFIQQLLGHEKLDTTAIYTEVSIKQLQEVHARCHPASRLPDDSETGKLGPMNAIPKKIVVDEKGAPVEVILPWSAFCEVAEILGLDLDAEAQADLRETRRDLEAGNTDAFVPLPSR